MNTNFGILRYVSRSAHNYVEFFQIFGFENPGLCVAFNSNVFTYASHGSNSLRSDSSHEDGVAMC